MNSNIYQRVQVRIKGYEVGEVDNGERLGVMWTGVKGGMAPSASVRQDDDEEPDSDRTSTFPWIEGDSMQKKSKDPENLKTTVWISINKINSKSYSEWWQTEMLLSSDQRLRIWKPISIMSESNRKALLCIIGTFECNRISQVDGDMYRFQVLIIDLYQDCFHVLWHFGLWGGED